MVNVCVDDLDFRTDEFGRLQLNPIYAQTAVATFTHTLTGSAGVYEDISELPDLAVPETGLYLVTFAAHGNATNTAASPGTVVGTAVSAALYKNDVLVPNTETTLEINSQGSSSVDQPALQLHGSGSCSQVLSLVKGDLLEIWAARNSDPGTTTQVLSNSQGRCRITALRLGSA